MMSSEDYIKASTKAWLELAARPDIVGKKVEYHSARRIEAHGELDRIEVKDGRVSIYCSNSGSSPGAGVSTLFKDFAIDEENDPSVVGSMIFCDLDDDSRNIQIHL